MPKRKQASELEYLRWFCRNADFGPAEGDVRYYLNRRFEEETRKTLPSGYEEEYDEDDESYE